MATPRMASTRYGTNINNIVKSAQRCNYHCAALVSYIFLRCTWDTHLPQQPGLLRMANAVFVYFRHLLPSEMPGWPACAKLIMYHCVVGASTLITLYDLRLAQAYNIN